MDELISHVIWPDHCQHSVAHDHETPDSYLPRNIALAPEEYL
jgi:hypothetical protein